MYRNYDEPTDYLGTYFKVVLSNDELLYDFKNSLAFITFTRTIIKKYEDSGLSIIDRDCIGYKYESELYLQYKDSANYHLITLSCMNYAVKKILNKMQDLGYYQGKQIKTYLDYDVCIKENKGLYISPQIFIEIDNIKRVFKYFNFNRFFKISTYNILNLGYPLELFYEFTSYIGDYIKKKANNNLLDSYTNEELHEYICNFLNDEDLCTYLESKVEVDISEVFVETDATINFLDQVANYFYFKEIITEDVLLEEFDDVDFYKYLQPLYTTIDNRLEYAYNKKWIEKRMLINSFNIGIPLNNVESYIPIIDDQPILMCESIKDTLLNREDIVGVYSYYFYRARRCKIYYYQFESIFLAFGKKEYNLNLNMPYQYERKNELLARIHVPRYSISKLNLSIIFSPILYLNHIHGDHVKLNLNACLHFLCQDLKITLTKKICDSYDQALTESEEVQINDNMYMSIPNVKKSIDGLFLEAKKNPAVTLNSLLKYLADKYNTTARPKRYFDVKKTGALTKKEQSYVKKRFKELVNREECLNNSKDDPKCYEKVSTDLSPKMKKRKSSYLKDYYEIYRPNEISTSKFIEQNKIKFNKEKKRCPNAPKGLIRIAVETGLPIEALKQVYDIGIGAYASSGSRTGMSAEQWGYGRVYSFIMCYYHNDNGRYSSRRYLKNKTDIVIYRDIENNLY